MKILVTAASRHGATREIAEAIVDSLREGGLDVDVKEPETVTDLTGYDAVIIGSAVYMRQWDGRALDFLERFDQDLKGLPVWGFSVGMTGVPRRAPQDPRRIGPNDTERLFRHHRSFAGRYDPTILPLRERTIARMAGAVEGDYRDWDEIAAWSAGIAQELQSSQQ